MTTAVPSWPALLEAVGKALVFSVLPNGVGLGSDVPRWHLTLTIRALESEDPRSYACRLRELLKLLETAMLVRDREIRTEIIAHANVPPQYEFTDEDFARACLLSYVRLDFECGASLDQVKWLHQFVMTFFESFEELSTSTEFQGQMSALNQRVGVPNELVTREEESSVRKETWCKCFLNFTTVDNSVGTWAEAEAKAFMELVVLSSSRIRQKFANVWQLGDWNSLDCEILLRTEALPINAALVNLLPSIAEITSAKKVTLNLSRYYSPDLEEPSDDLLIVTYHRPRATTEERPGFFSVNGGIEAQNEKAILLCQVISHEHPCSSLYIWNLRVKKESLAHALSTLLTNATGLRLAVVRAGTNPIEEMHLYFEHTTRTSRSRCQTLELRIVVHFEQFDEGFEVVMQVIGHKLHILEVKDAGSLEAGFSSILDFCPALKNLSVSDNFSSLGHLVRVASRRAKWTIEVLDIRMTMGAVDPLFTALCNPNHPITTGLTKLWLNGRPLEDWTDESGNPAVVEFRRSVECLPRIRSPLSLTYDFDHQHSMVAALSLVETMTADGAFDVHVPLPLARKYAFLSSIRTSLQERGILETIFRFAGSPATHDVTLNPFRRR